MANLWDPVPDAHSDAKTPASSLDPYARWAQLTNWRGYRLKRDNQPAELSTKAAAGAASASSRRTTVKVLVVAKDAQSRQRVKDIPGFSITGLYEHAPECLAFTGMCPVENLGQLSKVGRWELAVPERDALDAELHDFASQFGVGMRTDRLAPHWPSHIPAAGGELEEPLIDARAESPGTIAVIDFGCAFLNAEFGRNRPRNSPAQTRVQGLWVQGSPSGAMKKAPWMVAHPRLGYGAMLGPKQLQALYGSYWAAPDRIDERDAYRALGYLIDEDDPQYRIWYATHGTHVMSVAAGLTDPLTGALGADAASAADLLFVQLPALTAADSSGSSLGAYLLDGVQFALQAADPRGKLVINISYGSFAGSHDGHSLIEEALDELLERHADRLAIVIAAGNARQMQSHARRKVRPGLPARLYLKLSPADPTDTFVELWYPTPTRAGLGLKLRLRSPTGQTGDWTTAAQPVCLKDQSSGTVLAAAFAVPRPNQGRRQSLMLVCLGPTKAPRQDGLPTLDAGIWELEIALDLPAGAPAQQGDCVEFDAWVERDDPSGMSNAEQPHFEGLTHGDGDESLSSLATGRRTLVASGFRLDVGTAAPYASDGTRRASDVPLVYAACEEDAVHPTIRAAAVRSNECFRMNGTSVAAPVLARRVFNCWPTKTPIDWRAEIARIIDEHPDYLKR